MLNFFHPQPFLVWKNEAFMSDPSNNHFILIIQPYRILHTVDSAHDQNKNKKYGQCFAMK